MAASSAEAWASLSSVSHSTFSGAPWPPLHAVSSRKARAERRLTPRPSQWHRRSTRRSMRSRLHSRSRLKPSPRVAHKCRCSSLRSASSNAAASCSPQVQAQSPTASRGSIDSPPRSLSEPPLQTCKSRTPSALPALFSPRRTSLPSRNGRGNGRSGLPHRLPTRTPLPRRVRRHRHRHRHRHRRPHQRLRPEWTFLARSLPWHRRLHMSSALASSRSSLTSFSYSLVYTRYVNSCVTEHPTTIVTPNDNRDASQPARRPPSVTTPGHASPPSLPATIRPTFSLQGVGYSLHACCTPGHLPHPPHSRQPGRAVSHTVSARQPHGHGGGSRHQSHRARCVCVWDARPTASFRLRSGGRCRAQHLDRCAIYNRALPTKVPLLDADATFHALPMPQA